MVDSVTCLRYAECSSALGYVIRVIVARCRILAAHGAGRAYPGRFGRQLHILHTSNHP